MILRFLEQKVLKFGSRILQDYYNLRYDGRVDTCVVWSNKEGIHFKTSTTKGVVTDYKHIRSLCGSNKLFLHGPESLTEIVLIPFPSCIKDRGLKETRDFIKDWSGNSTVDNKEVVRYSTLF